MPVRTSEKAAPDVPWRQCGSPRDHTQITTIKNVAARVLATTLSSQSRKSPHSLDPRLLKERYIEKFAVLGDLRIPTNTSEGALGRGRLVAPAHGSIGRRSGTGWTRHTQVATCAPSPAQGRLLKAAIRVASHRRIRKCQPSRPMPVLPHSIRSSPCAKKRLPAGERKHPGTKRVSVWQQSE
jgi:hypothetical protein